MSDDQKRLGDTPIEERYTRLMQGLAEGVDKVLNGKAFRKDAENGFILMVFPIGDELGRANYISNVQRDDVVRLLKEQIARFEGGEDAKRH